jgi:hypothetical protein
MYAATLLDGRIGFLRDGEAYTMNADGSDVRNVSNTTANYEMEVAWQ